MGRKLYVGNLPYQVQESVITRPFSGAENAVVSRGATPHVGRERYEVVMLDILGGQETG